MKKLVLLIVVALTAFSMTSCNKDNEYAGTYSGTFSVVGTEKSINGKLVFTAGISDTENLYIYGVKLKKESDAKYTSDAAALSTIVALVSNESANQIEKINATFTFSGSQVEMKLQYNLLGFTDVTIITFTGTK